jgi:hypothetical protein
MCEMAIKKTAIVEAIDAKVDVFKLTVFKFRNSKISKGFGSKALVVNVLHDKGTKGFVNKGLYNFCTYVQAGVIKHDREEGPKKQADLFFDRGEPLFVTS